MANIHRIEIYAIVDPPLYKDVTAYLDGAPVYSDCADKASELAFTVFIPWGSEDYSKLVSPNVFVEDAKIQFRLTAAGEHYIQDGGKVTGDMRELSIKESSYTYGYGGVSIEVKAYDVTLDMKRIKNTFTWRFPNVLEFLRAMARRYSLTLMLKDTDAKLLAAIGLPEIQQVDKSDYEFVKMVLAMTGKTFLVSSAMDKLWVTSIDYKMPSNDALWDRLYKFTYTDPKNNKLLSAQVSIQRADKKETGNQQIGRTNIDEQGNVYTVAVDQSGRIRGGKYGVSRWDPKTSQWVPDDITIEEAMNPTVQVASDNSKQLPDNQKAKQGNPPKPIYIVNSSYVTTDENLFNYLVSNYFREDTKVLVEVYNRLDNPAIPLLEKKLGDFARLSLYERILERGVRNVAYQSAINSSDMSTVGKDMFNSMLSRWRPTSQLYRVATEADYKQHGEYASYVQTGIYKQYSDEYYADRVQSYDFRIGSTVEADSSYELKTGDVTVKGKKALEITYPRNLSSMKEADLEVQAQIRLKRGAEYAQAVAENIAVNTTGQVAQEQPDSIYTAPKHVTDQFKERNTLSVEDGLITTVRQPVASTVSVSSNEILNPNDPEKAKRVLEQQEDEKSKRSWSLQIETIFDPRYEPNKKVLFDGKVSAAHNKIWWCTEVEQKPGDAVSILTCICDYDPEVGSTESIVEELNEQPGELYVAFDQNGNQRAIVMEDGTEKRYALLRTLRLVEGTGRLQQQR